MLGKRIDAFQAYSIKFTKQSFGDKLWQQLYKYPDWGIGLYFANFHDREEIGLPFAIYGFFNSPFIRWKKSSFNYEIGFGATFNWKAYNPLTNKYNVAIGAGESFMVDAGLNYDYRICKRLNLSLGFSFTHFSNGTLKIPNYGINTIAPKISLKYNFNKDQEFIKREVPKYDKENEWLISIFSGVKNVVFDSANINILEKYEGVYYPVIGISTAYNKQVSYKSKIGIGININYNGSLNAQIAVDNNEMVEINGPFIDKLQVSIYPSYELVVNRVSLILQPAFYIYRKKTKNQSPDFHQRIGLKYQFSDRFFAGITLRDYAFHVSDFIEWNIGYRLKWR
jgi:hypothetical protein